MTSLKHSLVDPSIDSGLASKVFLRSSRGKCVKVVRELYLRQDIPCSSNLCIPCTAEAPPNANGKGTHTHPAPPPPAAGREETRMLNYFWRVAVKPFVLSDSPASTSRFRNGHYLIPDTNIFLYCMDIIEHHSAFYDVIVLQIVLEELRNRSLPLYNRLRALTASQDKRFYVFHNEFRKETYVKRLPGETINDRNDRAVRVACKWYKSHLQEAVAGTTNKCPEIVMLSDDKGNLERARADGVACCNSRFEWNCAERPD